MILVLGTGYIGKAFAAEAHRRHRECRLLSRTTADYTRFSALRTVLSDLRPELLINCAGLVGSPNIDANEERKSETLRANAVLVETVANACEVTGVPWAQICSGCIYQGFRDGNQRRHGWRETDSPNFCFDVPPCSWYSGSKALAEHIVVKSGTAYGWRIRMPFDEIDHPRNLLTKLQRYPKLLAATNSMSHRADCVGACLDLWDSRAPTGLYNVVNAGWVTTYAIAEIFAETRGPLTARIVRDATEIDCVAPRSSCVLATDRLEAVGIRLRHVAEAIDDSLRNWIGS